MEAVKSAVSYITFQRFYRFLLKRILGGFLIPDFEMHQLDVQLFGGLIQLSNVRLNATRLNMILKEIKSPLLVVSGVFHKLKAQIPWRSVLTESCKVYVSELRVQVSFDAPVFQRDTAELNDNRSQPKDPSESIAALASLVKQVLLNVEVCVDRIFVEISDSEHIVFETENIVLQSPSPSQKSLSIGESRVLIGRTKDQIIRVSPVSARLDCGEEARLDLNCDLVSVNIDRKRTLQAVGTCIRHYANPVIAESVIENTMFQSVVEIPSSSLESQLPWYEEIYRVIETEVMKDNDAGDFQDALEETSIPSELFDQTTMTTAKSITCSANIGTVRLSLLAAESELPGVSLTARGVEITEKPECVIRDYRIHATNAALDSTDMYVSMMSCDDSSSSSVYDSVLDSESSLASDLEEDGEEIDSDSAEIFTSTTSVVDRETLFFSDNVEALVNTRSSFPSVVTDGGTCIVGPGSVGMKFGSEIRVEFHDKIEAKLTPELIANLSCLSKLVGAILSSPAPSDNKALPVNLTCGRASISVDLGNGHTVALETDSVDGCKLGSVTLRTGNTVLAKLDEATVGSAHRVSSKKLWITQSSSEFLDLQLKVMSLLDQIGMVNHRLASVLDPSVPVSPPLILSLHVDACELRSIRLEHCLASVTLQEPFPLINVTVKRVFLGDFVSVWTDGSVPAIKVSVSMKPEQVTRINTIVEISGLHAQLDPKVFPDIERTIEYLNPKVDIRPLHASPLITAPPRPTITEIKIRVNNTFLSYMNDSVLVVDGLESSSGILSTVDKETPVGVSVGAETLSLLLSKNACTDWQLSPESDLKSNLRLRGFVPIAAISHTDVRVKWSLKNFQVSVSSQLARLDLKADTCDGLSAFISRVSEECRSVFQKECPQKNDEEAVTVSLPPFSVPVAAPQFVIKENYIQRCGRGGSRFARSEPTVPVGSDTARWLVDPKSLVLVHDHLSNSQRSHSDRGQMTEARKELEKHREEIGGQVTIHSLTVNSIKIFIVDGFDWEGTEYHLGGLLGSAKRSTLLPGRSMVCLEAENVSATRMKVKDWSNVSVCCGDFRIKDAVVGSVYQFILTQWGPRIGPDTISLHLSQREKARGEICVSPLCVTLDQDTVEFFSRFVSRVSLLAFKRTGIDSIDFEVMDSQSSDAEPPSSCTETEMRSVGETIFHTFTVSAIDIELNYKSKRVSLTRLRKGDKLELINMIPLLEGLKLHMHEVRMVDVVDVDDMCARLVNYWSKDINKAQILRSLSSITPIRSLTNLSSSISNLIHQPLRQLRRKDGHVSRGVLRGISSFVRTLAVESLNLADVMVSGAQAALEVVDSATGPSERIECTIDESDIAEGEEEWVSVEQGARRRALDPSSAIEGLRTGSESLLRGVNVTTTRGPSGFILQPAIGAAEAVSVVIRGARSAVDSGKHHAETERKYKGPYVVNDFLNGS